MIKTIKYTFLALLFVGCATTRVDPRALEFENKCLMESTVNAPTAPNTCSICLELNPMSTQCLVSLGKQMFEVKDFDKAINLFERALILDPRIAVAHNNLGVIYFIRGQYYKATERFHAATVIDPTYVDARMGLAISYYRIAVEATNRQAALENLVSCRDELQKVLAIVPNEPDATKALVAVNEYIKQLS